MPINLFADQKFPVNEAWADLQNKLLSVGLHSHHAPLWQGDFCREAGAGSGSDDLGQPTSEPRVNSTPSATQALDHSGKIDHALRGIPHQSPLRRVVDVVGPAPRRNLPSHGSGQGARDMLSASAHNEVGEATLSIHPFEAAQHSSICRQMVNAYTFGAAFTKVRKEIARSAV